MSHLKHKKNSTQFTSTTLILEKLDQFHRIWSHTNEHHAHFMHLFQTCLCNLNTSFTLSSSLNHSKNKKTTSTNWNTNKKKKNPKPANFGVKLPKVPTYVKIKDVHSKDGFKLVPRYMTPFSCGSASSSSSSSSTFLKRKGKLARFPSPMKLEPLKMKSTITSTKVKNRTGRSQRSKRKDPNASFVPHSKQTSLFGSSISNSEHETQRNHSSFDFITEPQPNFHHTCPPWLLFLCHWFHFIRPSSLNCAFPLSPSLKGLTRWQREPAFQWLSISTLTLLCKYGAFEVYPNPTWISSMEEKEMKWFLVLQGEVEVYIAKSYGNDHQFKKRACPSSKFTTSMNGVKEGVKMEVLKPGQAFGHLGTLMAGDLISRTCYLRTVCLNTVVLSVSKEEYLTHLHVSYQHDLEGRHGRVFQGLHMLPWLERARLVNVCEQLKFSAGHWIVTELDPVVGLSWIEEGEVDIYRTCDITKEKETNQSTSRSSSFSFISSSSSSLSSVSSNASSVLVWVARKTVGEYLGEEGVIGNGTFNPNAPPRSLITAKCKTPVTLARLPLLLARIKVASKLTLSSYLHYSNSELHQLYVSNLEQRKWKKTKKKVLKELGRAVRS